MEILGLTLNTVIVLLILGYLIYLSMVDNILPPFINDLFNNMLFRISTLVLIVFITIGHKDTGLGGPMIGIMLAIAYVITSQIVSKNTELFYIENYDENYENDEDEDEDKEDP